MLDFLWTNEILRLFYISIGVQWVGCTLAVLLHTEKFYDLTGSLTFLLLSQLSYDKSIKSRRQTVQTWMVFAWAVRLGLFLFIRIMKDGEDKRFDKGIWVFVTLLPTLLLNSSRRNPPIGSRDYIGWAIWTMGFVFEVVADAQKTYFRAFPANKGKFITTGLWSISRHPNYFGEISLWFGLYISASSSLSGLGYLSVLSPILVMLLITKVSGIPLLAAAGKKKWGEDPEYQRYVENTPVLIPFIKT